MKTAKCIKELFCPVIKVCNLVKTVIFAMIFVTMNGHTYILFKNILYDVQTKGKGEINIA